MSRFTSNYDELVNQYKKELLSDEQLMDKFEERFESRLLAKSKEAVEEKDSR
ncbi:FbpB family small basic protein [Ornithinibacillus halotolerans]|uniref:Fur-regulated basic protein B n=1 Tax=Ornithinibacillus halotolerans TaxID=1274357 RepID=A0A916RXQ8_9BACI|nr:FbpB family small basic protein [Ornithinibacillus halotolerans]GGA71364.1 hypothetical protein GCM10008025_14070 [Ornithinibacillus halotolerans]